MKTINIRIQKSHYIYFTVEMNRGNITVKDADNNHTMMFCYHNEEHDYYWVDSMQPEIFYFKSILKAKIERAFKIKFL